MRRIAIGIAVSIVAVLALTGHHGDITDNARVPSSCHEEDPCWNPASMGNGIGFVCRIEPSDTPEGFEIMAYHDLLGAMPEGFVVPCPSTTINGG